MPFRSCYIRSISMSRVSQPITTVGRGYAGESPGASMIEISMSLVATTDAAKFLQTVYETKGGAVDIGETLADMGLERPDLAAERAAKGAAKVAAVSERPDFQRTLKSLQERCERAENRLRYTLRACALDAVYGDGSEEQWQRVAKVLVSVAKPGDQIERGAVPAIIGVRPQPPKAARKRCMRCQAPTVVRWNDQSGTWFTGCSEFPRCTWSFVAMPAKNVAVPTMGAVEKRALEFDFDDEDDDA